MHQAVKYARLLLLVALTAVLCGCGGGAGSSGGSNGGGSGGSSGGNGSGGTPPPPPAPDFSLVLSPTQVSARPGWRTDAVDISVKPVNGFSGEVTVTSSLPDAIFCGVAACSGRISTGAQIRTEYFSAGKIAPGTYKVTFTGTSGTLSHQATLTIQVTVPPVASPNKSGYAFTGDPNPVSNAAIYDPSHNWIYVSNFQLGEIDVISPESLRTVKRIPVPAPEGIDLSPDNSTLYVGTNTEFFYEVDTTGLEVVKRVAVVVGTPATHEIPSQIMALADGNLMIVADCGFGGYCLYEHQPVSYSPSTGTFNQLTLPGRFDSGVGPIYRSADRQHVYFLAAAQTTGNLGRYDVATKALSFPQINVRDLAIKADGSGFAGTVGCCEIDFYDSNFSTLGTVVQTNPINSFYQGMVYSPDGSRLYAPCAEGIDVIDSGTFQPLGLLFYLPVGDNLPATQGWDGENRLLGSLRDGIGLIDATVPLRSFTQTPPVIIGGAGQTPVTPDNPTDGLAAVLGGQFFTEAPVVTFAGVPATDVQVTSATSISLVAPAIKGIPQADVAVFFPDGHYGVAPGAYTYTPSILYVDGNASAEAGGTTLTLYGYGFKPANGAVSVTIGGAGATNVVPSLILTSPPYPTALSTVTTTVPRGTSGSADITVQNAVGTATVHNGFHYMEGADVAVPSMVAPLQLILDKPHDRLLWTDKGSNQLVAFSLSSNTVEKQISLGTQPGGLALTPDGSDILVVLAGSNQLSVYDSGTLSLLQQASTPAPDLPSPPSYVAAVTNGKAFVIYAGSPDVAEYDIPSNTFTKRTDAIPGPEVFASASGDGQRAMIGRLLWTASTDAFTSIAGIVQDYRQSLSADGAVLSSYHAVYNQDGLLTGALNVPDVLPAPDSSIAGGQLNATGSLVYLPASNGVRIYDVHHGRQLQNILIPKGLNRSQVSGLAVDPDGQAMYALTADGVATFRFASDPLSIGEIQIAGTQVAILGSGFDSGAQVLVDGAPVSATVADSQHITATLSSNQLTGAHKLTVALPSGETYSLDDALEGFF